MVHRQIDDNKWFTAKRLK